MTKEQQKAMENVYGQFTLTFDCYGITGIHSTTAEVELHRSPVTDSISVNVKKCQHAEPIRGHGGHSCHCPHGGDYCKFSFDYPYIKEQNKNWQLPQEISAVLGVMKEIFGIN